MTESECTPETIHNKLCLFIIDQFHFYYHQYDHYIARSIERVIMHFFKNFIHAYEGHDFLSVLTHCIIVLYIITKMQCVRAVNMPCSSTAMRSLDDFSYVFHFRYRVDRWPFV